MSKKILLFPIIAYFLILPLFFALAQTPTFSSQGLWQNIPINDPSQIKLCHFFVLLRNLVTFVIYILGPLFAVFFLVIAGFLYVFSAEKSSNVQQAKDIMRSVFWGLVIIYGAWLLVSLFLSVMGVAEWTNLKDGWFVIKCD